MANSQDIFTLLLVVLFMSNRNADTQTINSTILLMLLLGSINNPPVSNASCGCGCECDSGCGNSRIASVNACRCCNG